MMQGMANPEMKPSFQQRAGMLTGIACYVLWGIFPLYWKLLSGTNSIEIICQRVIWCFVFTVGLCLIMRFGFISLLKSSRARRFLIPASILITINWSVYIYAVEVDKIIETAIGYYLNPLVSIVLGLIIFKERLTLIQWIAVGLCAIGIAVFTFGYEGFPWISVTLALSFGIYGAVKKKGGYPAIEALAVENTIVVIPAIIVAIVLANLTGSHSFLGDVQTFEGWGTTMLLVLGGAVTAVPLILFARAANLIPLTLLGFIQFLSPTIALIIGVFVNGEVFTTAHAICLGCIWMGLLLVCLEPFLRRER